MSNLTTLSKRSAVRSAAEFARSAGKVAARAALRLVEAAPAAGDTPQDFASAMRQVERDVYDIS
jgi:hypothetical protein